MTARTMRQVKRTWARIWGPDPAAPHACHDHIRARASHTVIPRARALAYTRIRATLERLRTVHIFNRPALVPYAGCVGRAHSNSTCAACNRPFFSQCRCLPVELLCSRSVLPGGLSVFLTCVDTTRSAVSAKASRHAEDREKGRPEGGAGQDRRASQRVFVSQLQMFVLRFGHLCFSVCRSSLTTCRDWHALAVAE